MPQPFGEACKPKLAMKSIVKPGDSVRLNGVGRVCNPDYAPDYTGAYQKRVKRNGD